MPKNIAISFTILYIKTRKVSLLYQTTTLHKIVFAINFKHGKNYDGISYLHHTLKCKWIHKCWILSSEISETNFLYYKRTVQRDLCASMCDISIHFTSSFFLIALSKRQVIHNCERGKAFNSDIETLQSKWNINWMQIRFFAYIEISYLQMRSMFTSRIEFIIMGFLYLSKWYNYWKS